MGKYLNPKNVMFQESLNSQIYVDKTGMLAETNKVIDTRQKFLCLSRPRRFGKSMTAEMLAAYYSGGCESKEMFFGLNIAKDISFEKHLNQYNVLFLNMQQFLSRPETLIENLEKRVIRELAREYPDSVYADDLKLVEVLEEINSITGRQFVVIIDEWDCIFREYKSNSKAQIKYLDFLRDLLKDRSYVSLAYMTGILPIKKYGTHSALNMFSEYSMTDAGRYERFVGFTEHEVEELCHAYHVDFEEMKRWYDGYLLGQYHIFNPKSVVEAIDRGYFNNYWTQTETYEALKIYIDMNYDGLRDAITEMLGGARCEIDSHTFQNDMATFESKDDVLTLLVHLGYLAYCMDTNEVYIPNEEVRAEFARAIKASGWNEVVKAINASKELLQAVLNGDAETVAAGVGSVHDENISILQYNNENALSCVISLAFYMAREKYRLIRELPTGKGFADIVLIPRPKHLDESAMVLELKWNQSANTAIQQIKDKQYCKSLENYSGEIVLVGISYDKKTKKHECVVERVEK